MASKEALLEKFETSEANYQKEDVQEAAQVVLMDMPNRLELRLRRPSG